jgi:hypothetical protein
MKLKLLVAVAALPMAAAANAGNVYSACEYEDSNTGKRPFTQLFTLEGDALKDSYGAFSYDKTLEWEANAPVDKYTNAMRVSGYMPNSLVGQFMKFAESKNERGDCMVTTDKERAFAWYRQRLADGRYDKFIIEDWRPSEGSFISAEQWPPN